MGSEPGLNFNDKEINMLQKIMMEEIQKVLPKVINDIIPIAIEKVKNIYKSNQSDEKEKIVTANRQSWNKALDERESLVWKHHRNVRLLDLYGECLQSEEMYIPRKFRNDKTHTKNQSEAQVIRKLELQKFQAECEILKIRKDNFASDISLLDEKVKNEIRNTTENVSLQLNLLKDYECFVKKDLKYITEKWDKKIEGMKEAYKKDRNDRENKHSHHNISDTNTVKNTVTDNISKNDTNVINIQPVEANSQNENVETDNTNENSKNEIRHVTRSRKKVNVNQK